MKETKKTSIKDVAREANFSISTVSRALNGKGEEYRIAKTTQKIILDVAKKLNYVPNFSASNLKSGITNTIALSIPSLNNLFFAYLASEINSCMRKEGFITLLSETSESVEEEKEVLQNILKRDIDGLIHVPVSNQTETILQLHNTGLPIVCVDRYYEELELPYVTTNNFKGAFDATSYLIENGHKDILCIQGTKASIANSERVRGFKAAMANAGLDSSDISGNDFSVQNGYIETKLALKRTIKPSAMFAFSNTIALGSLKAIEEEKLSIPTDISLITFDDHPYLDYLKTPLSCVVQPTSDIASLAVKMLISLKNQKKIESKQIKLDPILKIRNSVGKR